MKRLFQTIAHLFERCKTTLAKGRNSMKQTETLSHALSTLANTSGQFCVRKTIGESPGSTRARTSFFLLPHKCSILELSYAATKNKESKEEQNNCIDFLPVPANVLPLLNLESLSDIQGLSVFAEKFDTTSWDNQGAEEALL